MDWSVRLLEMNDVPILLDWYNNEELHNIANAKKYKPYTLEQLTDYWREKLSRPKSNYYVIVMDEQVVGRTSLKKKENKEGFEVEYSILIGVPTLYSKGLGTKVTKYFISEAFLEPDILSVYLAVRTDNVRAIRCYEKVGFQVRKVFYENDVKMYEMRIDKVTGSI
jgi:RimJ/RimL family protein N-acetyltransferase